MVRITLPAMSRVVAVLGSSAVVPGDPDYEDGRRVGRLLAEAGFAVATGGYGGLMEAVSAGARDAAGTVIGVTAPSVFPNRSGPNPFLTEERPAAGLIDRYHELVEGSDASIALPGSIGTLTELMVAWNLAFVAPFSGRPAKPVVAVGEVWRRVVSDLSELVGADASLVTCVDGVDEAVAQIARRLPG